MHTCLKASALIASHDTDARINCLLFWTVCVSLFDTFSDFFFWPLLCTSTSVTMRYYHCRTNDVSPQKSTVSNFFLLDYFMEFIVFKAEGSYLQALDPCQKRLHMNYSVLFS